MTAPEIVKVIPRALVEPVGSGAASNAAPVAVKPAPTAVIIPPVIVIFWAFVVPAAVAAILLFVLAIALVVTLLYFVLSFLIFLEVLVIVLYCLVVLWVDCVLVCCKLDTLAPSDSSSAVIPLMLLVPSPINPVAPLALCILIAFCSRP